MKFSIFNFKKDNTPPLSSLRPVIFNAEFRWVIMLLVFLFVIIVTGAVGLNLFYSVYSENYRGNTGGGIPDNLIDVPKLSRVVNERNNFINATTTIPSNPFR